MVAVLLCLLLQCVVGVTKFPPGIRILHANVGNLDEDFGPCPAGEPYKGGLCSLAQEDSMRKAIRLLQPHLVTLVEIVSEEQCKKNNSWCPPPTSSSSYVSDAPCCHLNRLNTTEQVLRLLPPSDGWAVACDTNDGHACVGVRSNDPSVPISLIDCTNNGTICPLLTPPLPSPSCSWMNGKDMRADVSWASLLLWDAPFQLGLSHPLWLPIGQGMPPQAPQCVADQFTQMLRAPTSGRCVLLAGDWNDDCYRAPEDWLPACAVWRGSVGGEGMSYEAVFHNASNEVGKPLPTWGEPLPFFTLDYFLRHRQECIMPDGFNCKVLGVSPGTTRFDFPQNTCDHKALLCTTQQ